jgi:single-strand DNA-binding protein
MVTGRLRQRSWETPEGDKRSVTELEADEVGASLKWATAGNRRCLPAATPKSGNGLGWTERRDRIEAGSRMPRRPSVAVL